MTLQLFLLPLKMKIKSKMKVLVFTALYMDFSRRARAGYSSQWSDLVELIQAFMNVLVSCKNEVDPNKNEGARVITFLPLLFYGDFFRRSRAAISAVHDPIRLSFELSPDFMVVLFTCKNEEDSIKNEGARVFTTLNIDFQALKGR